MNWLAHILLSKPDVEYQIGNLLADPLKGKPWPTANQAVIDGMQMHVAIDVFTDAHPVVSQSKARLGKGYLKGVVVDLLYDHFLAKHWQNYTALPLTKFVDSFHANAKIIATNYPERPQRIVNGISNANILNSYEAFEGFERALHRIDSRLSERAKAKDSALNYVAPVLENYASLESDFKEYFPELVGFFMRHELGSTERHFFK